MVPLPSELILPYAGRYVWWHDPDRYKNDFYGHHGGLAADEVICGFGRTGQTFAAQSFGVTPDLMTMAKGITNGAQPMGAVAISERIHDTIMAAAGHQAEAILEAQCLEGWRGAKQLIRRAHRSGLCRPVRVRAALRSPEPTSDLRCAASLSCRCVRSRSSAWISASHPTSFTSASE